MRHAIRSAALIGPLVCATALAGKPTGHPTGSRQESPKTAPSYATVVRRVASMTHRWKARRLVRRRGLRVLNVLWEDTGRYHYSSVGPNISDVTIEVSYGRRRTKLMPVIRYPNFTDKTADIRIDQIFVPVGNENKHGRKQMIPLTEYLRSAPRYMSYPQRGYIRRGSLLAKRDTHVLVSAQAAFLPIKGDGKATFWPVIFNYQSSHRNPAVLTLLVTRQGTSMTVIENSRDSVTEDSWGQRLFFNKGGMKAPLTAERSSTVQRRGTTSNGEHAANLRDDANMLMLIQVPLRIRPRRPRPTKKAAPAATLDSLGGAAQPARRSARARSDVEQAVLGHGPIMGKYRELSWNRISRDRRFPIRVTIQFYQATSNGVIDGDDVARLHAQISKVYEKGDYVGSLVIPGGKRPTEWTGATSEPGGLTWRSFAGLRQHVRRYGALSLGALIRRSAVL